MNSYCDDNITKLSERIKRDFSLVSETKFPIDKWFYPKGKYIFLLHDERSAT